MIPLLLIKNLISDSHLALSKMLKAIAIFVCIALHFVLGAPAYGQSSEAANTDQIRTLQAQLDSVPPDDFGERAKLSLFLIYAYEEAGEFENARQTARSIGHILDKPIEEGVKSYVLYRVLMAHANKGEYQTAFSLLENYRETATDDTKQIRRYTTIRALAEIYENLGYFERSAAIIEEALITEAFFELDAFKNDLVLNNVHLANQYNRLKKSALAFEKAADARKALNGLITTNPNANSNVVRIIDTQIERAIIESLIGMGRYEEADEKLEAFVERAMLLNMRSEYLEAVTHQAKLLVRKDNYVAAQPLFQSVVTDKGFDPMSYKSVNTLVSYAATLRTLGQTDKALYYYAKADKIRQQLSRQRFGSRSLFVAAEIDNAARKDNLKKLEMQSAIAEASARRSNIIAGLSLLTALIAFMAMIGFYRSWKVLRAGRIKLQNYAKELKRSEAAAQDNAVKAEAASEAKTAFLANMSHEIRTPMNGVLGMAQVLKGLELNSAQTECVDVIQSTGEALMRIINDILDFSKIDAGKLELDPVPSCLRRSVEDVTTMLASSAAQKGIELLVRFEPGVPTEIVADIGRIRQILINLICNGIKFTETGYVFVNISGQRNDGAANIKFEVFDTGIGIPSDKITEIFTEFNQAENSTTRRHGGTGLGLTITKRLIDAMGGELKVTSKYGTGSSFYFELSFPCPDAMSEQMRPAVALPDMTILLVSRSPLSLKILKEECESLSMTVKICEAGKPALHELRAALQSGRSYDVVLAEDNLKDISAEAFVANARKYTKAPKTKLIWLSHALENEARRALSVNGVDSFILKPHKQSALLSVLSQPRPDVRPAERPYKHIELAS